MLLTPTCSMIAQGSAGYAHVVRLLAPVLPLQRLIDEGAVKPGAVDDLRRRDHLVNYFYVPAIPAAALPESLALLYSAITVHHNYLEERRIAQLSKIAAVHLEVQDGCALWCGGLFSHQDFDDEIR